MKPETDLIDDFATPVTGNIPVSINVTSYNHLFFTMFACRRPYGAVFAGKYLV